MIDISNLSVIFNRGDILESRALIDVSLNVNNGEFITVIGSNGAGKSSLLAAIAGDISPDEGSIRIDDKDVSAWRAHQRAALVARVFQDPLAGTCARLTIAENLSLAASRGGSRGLLPAVTAKKRQLFAERLRILDLDLENRLDDYVGQLSGGQRQALSLIMATTANSRILLLDEHTAALDPRMAEFVLQLTERICQEYSLTVLMVTHSMQSALALGKRTIMLHQGKIVLDFEGETRAGLRPAGLLDMFAAACGKTIDNDRMLLSAAGG